MAYNAIQKGSIFGWLFVNGFQKGKGNGYHTKIKCYCVRPQKKKRID